MPYKFTMLFNFGGSGFSETWYYNGGVTFPVPQNSVFDQVYQQRALMTGIGTSPEGWRLSDLSNPRSTYVRYYSKVAPIGKNPDPPSTAWLADVRGVNGIGRRQLWLRCVPDEWVEYDSVTGRFTPVGPLVGALQAFTSLLTTPPWSIRTVVTLAASGIKSRVTSLAQGALGGTQLNAATTGFNLEAPIVVSGFRKPLGVLNGNFDAVSAYTGSSGQFNLNHKAVTTAELATYNGGAWVRQATFSYTNIGTIDLIQPRERKVGRAFFVPRGRR